MFIKSYYKLHEYSPYVLKVIINYMNIPQCLLNVIINYINIPQCLLKVIINSMNIPHVY